MLSALEHYSYCPRQCALIHVEQVWDENLYTMRGRDVHERVDEVSFHVLVDVWKDGLSRSRSTVNDKRCDGCSLKESCLPAVVAEKERGRKAVKLLFENS